MDFSMITNMNSYLKAGALKQTWMQKAQNPTSSGAMLTGAAAQGTENNDQKQGVMSMLESLQRQTENQDHRLSSIISKMQSGQDISSDDLEYLRKTSPETYEKAVKLIREKEEYERELRNCKTKEEARSLQMSKVSEALSKVKMGQEAGDVATCMEASAKLNMMSAVFTEFTQTVEYEDMADSALELAEAIEAERQETEEVQDTEEVPAEEEPAVESELPNDAGTVESAGTDDGDLEAPQVSPKNETHETSHKPGGSKTTNQGKISKGSDVHAATHQTDTGADQVQRKAVRHAKGYSSPSSTGNPAGMPDPTFSIKA